MARTRSRSPSQGPADPAVLKRQKTVHPPNTPAQPPDPFYSGLFDHNTIARLNADYIASRPFKHALVDKLFHDDLLSKVKDECLSELSFTEKETDIYKVNQTGDLASLNYLPDAQSARLPNLRTLRDALYSPEFRNFLRAVTGCGPLSGTKQDMSVNSYTRGCHLLNHDDVIGTRRVSYILYMPLPHYQLWQKDWGGALELYPVQPNEDGQLEPEPIPSKSIPPSWNQFIFFEVQPGKSFHSVEEVVVGGEGEDGRNRLSISGWFHAAQEGEEGYVPEPPTETKSSREQLASTSTVFKPYTSDPKITTDNGLSPEDHAFLSEYLNPVYLQKRTMQTLAARFVLESSLELHSFLTNELAEALEPRLRQQDANDGLGDDRVGSIPPHTAGTSGNWRIKGPPHKWRYCNLKPRDESGPLEAVAPLSHGPTDEIMRKLQDDLFSSPAFRSWLTIVTKLTPMSHATEARRFRPGLDYTLATSEENEARLDVVLGLTPGLRESDSDEEERFIKRHGVTKGWQAADWGGWECYMAPHNEEDDPAVYRSGSTSRKGNGKSKSVAAATTNGSASSQAGPAASSSSAAPIANGNGTLNGQDHEATATTAKSARSPSPPSSSPRSHPPPPPHPHEDEDAQMDNEEVPEEEEEEAPEDDSTLLAVQPGFNRLLMVLRDERVMRFVKYVSAAAEGSRWDICGEYEVGMIMEEEQEGDADGSVASWSSGHRS